MHGRTRAGNSRRIGRLLTREAQQFVARSTQIAARIGQPCKTRTATQCPARSAFVKSIYYYLKTRRTPTIDQRLSPSLRLVPRYLKVRRECTCCAIAVKARHHWRTIGTRAIRFVVKRIRLFEISDCVRRSFQISSSLEVQLSSRCNRT